MALPAGRQDDLLTLSAAGSEKTTPDSLCTSSAVCVRWQNLKGMLPTGLKYPSTKVLLNTFFHFLWWLGLERFP